MRSDAGSTVYFVCDANHITGMGHFLRCISLAMKLQDMKYQSIFIGDFSANATAIAADYPIQIVPSDQTVPERLRQLPHRSKVVVDSYQYTCTYLPDIHQYLLIDDFFTQTHYPVRGVINFTYRATNYNYCEKGADHQALGLSYYLAHPSLAATPSDFCPEVSRILVMIGSGDPYQLANKAIAALQCLNSNLHIKVVTSDAGKIQETVADCLVEPVPMISDVNQYYQWADFCVTSGGLAKYECAYLAKPAAVISLTDAEQQETNEFSADQLCFDLGYHSQITLDSLVKNLTQIISQPQLRLAAHQSCLHAFKNHSAVAITEFVAHCWGACHD